MEPRISFITLGVGDLTRAIRFYVDVLGLAPLPSPPAVAFFEMGKTWLALYPCEELAADAGVSAEGAAFPASRWPTMCVRRKRSTVCCSMWPRAVDEL